MLLEGSCHCGSVRFSVESHAPCPFMYCYCTICRKVGGGGGYAINIMGETPLPPTPERIHMMLNFAAPWVAAPENEHDHHIAQYPDESLEGWHRKHGLYVD